MKIISIRFLGFVNAGIFVGVLLSGCLANMNGANLQANQRPNWIDNPGEGVSASAGVHVRGRVAQEALAVTRAREELAKRLGVKIDSQSTTDQRVSNDRMSSTSSKQIQEIVTAAEVKAAVKAKWLEPGSDVLWVWLMPNP